MDAWKIKTDLLPTRFNISRRGIDIESIMCPICVNGAESVDHLFFTCSLVRHIANKITHWWDISFIECSTYEDWKNWLVNLHLPAKHKQILEGVFYVMWWLLWLYRNKVIFESKVPLKALLFEDVVSKSFIWSRTLDIDVKPRLVWMIGLKTLILSLCNC